MDLIVDVFYSNNKAGTYVQFELPVNCRELSELNAYDKILQRQISQDFEELFEVFAMDFSTESSYLVQDGEKSKLVICLQGKTTDELEEKLASFGVQKREF